MTLHMKHNKKILIYKTNRKSMRTLLTQSYYIRLITSHQEKYGFFLQKVDFRGLIKP